MYINQKSFCMNSRIETQLRYHKYAHTFTREARPSFRLIRVFFARKKESEVGLIVRQIRAALIDETPHTN